MYTYALLTKFSIVASSNARHCSYLLMPLGAGRWRHRAEPRATRAVSRVAYAARRMRFSARRPHQQTTPLLLRDEFPRNSHTHTSSFANSRAGSRRGARRGFHGRIRERGCVCRKSCGNFAMLPSWLPLSQPWRRWRTDGPRASRFNARTLSLFLRQTVSRRVGLPRRRSPTRWLFIEDKANEKPPRVAVSTISSNLFRHVAIVAMTHSFFSLRNRYGDAGSRRHRQNLRIQPPVTTRLLYWEGKYNIDTTSLYSVSGYDSFQWRASIIFKCSHWYCSGEGTLQKTQS